jgi:RimJ/RimL family protein N-acetyltransferase
MKGFNFIIERLSGPDSYQDEIGGENGNVNGPKIIGAVGMVKENEIGYMLHPTAWGKGYATEALRSMISEYYQQFPGADPLRAYSDALNAGSNKVLLKSGFKEIGREIFPNVTLGPREAVVYEYEIKQKAPTQ